MNRDDFTHFKDGTEIIKLSEYEGLDRVTRREHTHMYQGGEKEWGDGR
jgi:hypothetical protein